MTTTHYRVCPFCEATCGLALEVEGRTVKSIRGDEADVFSRGFICPKGVALSQLDADPDRLRQPMMRRGSEHVPVTWEEAFAEIERRLPPIIAEHGNDAAGVYLGNPSVHNLSLSIYGQVFLRPPRARRARRRAGKSGTVHRLPLDSYGLAPSISR